MSPVHRLHRADNDAEESLTTSSEDCNKRATAINKTDATGRQSLRSDTTTFHFFFKESSTAGLNIQTSFMFFTVGIVPVIVGTIAFLPKSRIPWPLPENYSENRDSLSYYVQKHSFCNRTRQGEFFIEFTRIFSIFSKFVR